MVTGASRGIGKACALELAKAGAKVALAARQVEKLEETAAEIRIHAYRDAVLVKVEALGPGVCHNGYESCFYRRLEGGRWVESEARTYDPAAVYGSKE